MKSPTIRRLALTLFAAASILSLACGSIPSLIDGPQGVTGATPTFTPFQPLEPTSPPGSEALSIPDEVIAQVGLTLWVDTNLPPKLRETLALPAELRLTDDPAEASLRVEAGDHRKIGDWLYVLVTPFPTITDGVAKRDIKQSWKGNPEGPFEGLPLLMDASTQAVISAHWGPPEPGAVETVPTEQLLSHAWGQRPSWAIVPFEALEPRWKVLEVDGNSPIRKDFDLSTYVLNMPVSLSGDEGLAEAMYVLYGPGTAAPLMPRGNRNPNRMTTLAMTGVTALVRATAYAMEQQGTTYPGQDIRDWLREADLTHISNEVPFEAECPYPDPVQRGVVFCSAPNYIELLEDVGTDIVELTGDHFADWGTEAMTYTLELYKERGWPYYGGGANIEEGREALVVEHNGNRLAFIGCNGKGGGFATASDTEPGAVTCNFPWMESEIARLRAEGVLPIGTFQHFEYYAYAASDSQIRDFQRLAEAGAVIVSGSQAHHPQVMEFFKDAFIHYGLGNLFFDQYEISEGTRQGFIDRHVFYEGRHISTELLTILFIDFARPRPMTPEERQALLEAVFSASVWVTP